jgi:large subunit ribosomal protein L15
MPLHMRLPKLRGFKNPFRTEYQVVNLDRLSALYPDGGDVTVDDLVAKGAVRDGHLVKVLGTGELTTAVNVTVHKFSGSAKEKIESAGGSATTL